MWRICDSLDSYANHPCLPRPDILPGRSAGCDHSTGLRAAALRQKAQWRMKLVFVAKKNTKRVGLRVQMSAPDYTHDAALPDVVPDNVPKVDLVLSEKENSASAQRYLRNPQARYQPGAIQCLGRVTGD